MASRVGKRARSAVLFVSGGTCRVNSTQPGGYDFGFVAGGDDSSGVLSTLFILLGVGAGVEAAAAAMRHNRFSRYSAYSAWSVSQRSLERARKPALLASDSSMDKSSSSSVGASALSLS